MTTFEAGLLVLATVLVVLVAVVAWTLLRRGWPRSYPSRITSASDALPPPDRVRPANQTGRRPPDPGPPEDLVDAIVAGECVLFSGAGVNAAAGGLEWPDLLRRLVDRLQAQHGNLESLARQLDAGETALVAEILRGRYSDEDLSAAARDVLRGVKHDEDAPLVRALRTLPVAGVATDDWTPFASAPFREKGLAVVTPDDAEDGTAALRDRRFFVLHAFGLAGQRVLLGFDDYSRAIEESRDFGLFVGALLATRSLLFVGTSVGGVEQFLIGSGIRGPGSRRHFALVPAEAELELRAERLRERFGVEVLAYPVDRDHSSVVRFVDRLAAEARNPARRRAPVRDPDVLERILLVDVGPFRKLDMRLTRRWNVVLGDNAVGKSTVLRAMALCLAGGAPGMAEAPGRLLRAGADTGLIELEIGGVTYRTRLVRERDRVRAEAELVTPVQSGAWLAIGFPALRGVSTSDPKGIVTRPSVGPSVEDLAPLLRDAPDTRLDDLKGWIFTNWVLSRDQTSPDAERHGRMLATFFRLLRDINGAAGFDFEFRGVDQRTGRLLLVSPDGPISFDDLSQGMTSFLGGIGVLLQRLYEVYPDDPAPEQRNALLLIDELDVHLHPRWQWELLPSLRRTFRGLQLFATTHSPLVVVNAEPGEVHRVWREGGTLESERLDEPLRGHRADQILTGPAFRLDTTIDEATAGRLEDYRQLQVRAARGDASAATAAAGLADELGKTMPRTQETEQQREAAELLSAFLEERLRAVPKVRRDKVIEEARAAYAELQDPEGGAP